MNKTLRKLQYYFQIILIQLSLMALRNFKSLLPNHLIHPEANLPQGEKTQDDKVIGRTKDPNYDTVVK